MKIKKGFMLREVAGSHIVVAVGEASKIFKGIITLNHTGEFLWNSLKEDCSKEELVRKLLDVYNVDEKRATEDVEAFIKKLNEVNILE